MIKQQSKNLLQDFKKEEVYNTEIIKGGPETSRGTVTTVKPSSGTEG